MSAPDFRLNASDRESPLWRLLSAHITERREMLRCKLEGQQPVEKTEFLRGQIAELRALLDLAEERKRPT